MLNQLKHQMHLCTMENGLLRNKALGTPCTVLVWSPMASLKSTNGVDHHTVIAEEV